jgi:arylformamidase
MAEGESSNVSAIHMGTHTGTHIDAPLHVDHAGNDAAGIPVRFFIGPARVIPISAKTCIQAADLSSLDWHGVERVLFRTRSSSLREQVFDPDFVCLGADAADFLARKGMLLVGIDTPSVDPFDSTDLRSHKTLIRNGTVILENVQLGHVSPGDYNLICLPLKIAGADGSPVRAVLWRD